MLFKMFFVAAYNQAVLKLEFMLPVAGSYCTTINI